jgi:hypothetical protein
VLAVAVLAVSLLGVLGGAAAGARRSAQRAPSSVAILVAGFFSSLPRTETYDPLTQGAADLTRVKAEFDPRGIDSTYGARGCQATPSLTTALARRGAVIVPFSYRGVRLSGAAAHSRLTVRSYSKTAPSTDSPTAAAAVLAREVADVHRYWPRARIVLVGHSEGGLVAETYFAGRYRRAAEPEVAGIFSLDGPINGVRQTGLAEGVVGLARRWGLTISPRLIDGYFAAWRSITVRGPSVIRRDLAAGRVYVPVGTPGDHLYGIADAPEPGLRSQLLLTSSGRYSTLGLVDPATPPALGAGADLVPTLTASHECVLANSTVIRAITRRLR